MKKTIALVMVLLVCVGIFAGCVKEEEKEKQIFELEGMNITAENLSPYEGLYLENEEQEDVTGVYAMKFTNNGDQTIQNAQLFFSNGTDEMMFVLEMLPAGQSVTVVEFEKLEATDGEVNYIDGTISYLEAGLENMDSVEVTGGNDGMIQVKNTTDEVLPLLRVFYRQTDSEGNMIGGPCHSVMIDGMEAGGIAEIEAEFWTDDSVVVTVLVINQ